MGKISGLALLAACSVLAIGTATAQTAPAPVVAVTGGQVKGRLLPNNGGATFQGIPYAAPPIGNLRWRETQPVKPWTGVLTADKFRTGCGSVPRGADPKTFDIEDCLFLNVWSPEWNGNAPAGAKKPVMFWINGGGLSGGSGVLQDGAESLAQKGVILVSANYRGTLIGMMGHAELSAESPNKSTGNYGAHDEIAVLEWIQKNIAKFGGDPNNVTIFGQSGGGHMTSMLMTSPRSKGLFHKAIIHSGSPFQSVRPYLTQKELETIGKVTAEVLGAPATNQIEFLRKVPATVLADTMPAVRTKMIKDYDYLAYDWGVDGYTVTRPGNEVWNEHKEMAIPLLVGSTGVDSGSAPTSIGNLKPDATAEEKRAWKKVILERFFEEDPDLLQRALQLYGVNEGPNEISSYPPYGTDIQQIGLHINHACSVGITASNHSAIAPTWVWEFSRIDSVRPPNHGSELRYVFGIKALPDAAARKQADIIQSYWTNFAKTGNPNGPGLPNWAQYNTTTKPTLEFAQDGPVERQKLREVVCGPYVEKFARHPNRMSNGQRLMVRGQGGAL